MGIRPYISAFLGKPLLYSLIGFSLWVLSVLILKRGLVSAMVLAVTPLAGYLLIRLLERPVLTFFGIITVNYFIMGLTRYIPGLPAGIVMDGLLLLTLIFILFRSRERVIDWTGARNLLTLLSGIWLVYCILLVFNPDTTPADWAAGVRGLGFYLFIFPLLTAVLLNRYKHLKIFLFVWSILTLLAVLKVFIQKNIGFDPVEKYWLYELDGARTHIIYSGVRYFSFFTDAASFGSSMGLSMTVFSIYALYCSKRSSRFYYLFVSLAAGYGMMVSGTRAAIFIPFAGYLLFIFLSKQWRIIFSGIILLLCVFVFFKYTYIGHGNTEIRRMRSAFNKEQDASYNVRFENQEKMKVFMYYHPFGIGIGKAKRATPNDYMYQLPTDSSFVLIWVETGIVGLFIFLSVFMTTLIKGSYDVLFRIQNRELRGSLYALLAGLGGMMVCGYGSEILQQFPNGPIVYICMAFIIMGRKFDQAITDERAT